MVYNKAGSVERRVLMAIKSNITIMSAYEETDVKEGITFYHAITYSKHKHVIFKVSYPFFPYEFNTISLTRLTLDQAREKLKNAAIEQGLIEFKDFTTL